jgi:uncharacterized membrane protein YfcA
MATEIAWLAASVIAGGVVTGILAGLFGIGGGAVIVPVLYEIFRLLGVPDSIRMQLCIGTSLAIIVPTTLRSYHTHKMRGVVLSDVMRRWALPSMAGVAVGSVLAAIAPADIFKATFVVIASAIAAKFLIGGERSVVGTELPGSAAMSGYGFVIGLASSLMGISGGSLVTMVLTLYGKPIHNAVATAAGLGVPDYASRHDRLCSGRRATSSHVATAITRFRISHRCRRGCTGFELGRALRCPPRTQAAEAKTGNQLRLVPAACRRTLPGEPRTSYLTSCEDFKLGYAPDHWRFAQV